MATPYFSRDTKPASSEKNRKKAAAGSEINRNQGATTPLQVDVFACLSSARRDARLLSEKFTNFVDSADRYGDLQVAQSAIKRIQTAIELLESVGEFL